jgi:hypothetical protein
LIDIILRWIYPKAYNKIKNADYIVIHHTGVEENQEADIIDKYHREQLNWKGIGYDIYISKSNLYLTFRLLENIQGAHAKGYNKNIGICLSGDEFFNNYQKITLIKILYEINQINPNLMPVYHRELNNTACPGDNLIAFINDYIQENKA